jgi:hypothetical protein
MVLASCFFLGWPVWIIHRSEASGRAKVERALHETPTNILFTLTVSRLSRLRLRLISASAQIHTYWLKNGCTQTKTNYRGYYCRIAVNSLFLFLPGGKLLTSFHIPMEFAVVSAVRRHSHPPYVSHSAITNTKMGKRKLNNLPSFGMDRITLTAAWNASSVDIFVWISCVITRSVNQ